MKNQNQKKLLLAVDGSDYALNAVKYISALTSFHKMKVMLFHVFSGVPESYLDLEKDPQFARAARTVMAWEMQQKKEIQEYMQKAKQTLVRSGFSPDAVTIKIQNRKKGIARDIIQESKKGYSAIVVGRKGQGVYPEIVVGSVATKIVQKIAFLPILMIGEFPLNEKILVALDSSENARLAVDYLAATLEGGDFKINLFHVIRGTQEVGFPFLFLSKESLDQATHEIESVFAKAKRRLTDAGFTSDQITTQVIVSARSRAGSIVKEAREGDYGTIVMGRRGLSKVQEFFMGRVSNKVINTIRNRAVWVVT
jgi:nucleotide-binding universal stress UspA family protein